MLVGENMLCKVSDFGLSRELHAEDDQEPLDYETQVHAQVFQSKPQNNTSLSNIRMICCNAVENLGKTLLTGRLDKKQNKIKTTKKDMEV